MATNNISLVDGDGYETGQATITYNGKGNENVSVSSEECVGLDREGAATFKADGCADVVRKVFQSGLREPFAGADDSFIVADGGTFHVLKSA